ncbi:cytochrome P450 family protein [Ceratobasidium sp. AG-Ba]|nr:cytochrome P450 family protein [Ceratobasidium sp. AG-Ba]
MGVLAPWVRKWVLLFPWFRPGSAAVESLAGMANAAVDKRLREGLPEGEGDYDEEIGRVKRVDLLEKLMDGKDEFGEPLGREELTAEALTLMIAATDTTSNSSSAITYYLAAHPGSNKNSKQSWTKRLDLPIQPTSGHPIHHHSEVWGDDSEEFKPERWLDKKGVGKEFVPFSFGPRACVGRNLTNLMIIIIIASLFYRYDVTLQFEGQKTCDVLLGHDGVPLALPLALERPQPALVARTPPRARPWLGPASPGRSTGAAVAGIPRAVRQRPPPAPAPAPDPASASAPAPAPAPPAPAPAPDPTLPPPAPELSPRLPLARQRPRPVHRALHHPNGTNGPPILVAPHWQQQLHRAELCRQAASPHHRARAAALASRTSAKSAIPITAPGSSSTPKPASSSDGSHNRNGSVSTDASDDRASSVANGHPSANAAPVVNVLPRPSSERKQTSTWTTLDMGGMRLKNVSQSLFKLDYLTTLYINHNQLTVLPAEISQLRQLILLDVSGNQLVSLPPELGLITTLRELHAFDNRLETVPPELGTLYQLEMLGIEGNPLQASLRAILQKDGTPALISYLRDSCPVPSPPPDREWRELLDPPSPGVETFSVLSYNILCERCATTTMYGYTPSWALNWSYRKELILAEVLNYGCDFLCLQEVDIAQYEEYFLKKLDEHKYTGIFSPKFRARTMNETERRRVDGCAIFFRSEKWCLVEHHLIEFSQASHTRPALRTTKDWFNRVQTRDHIAIAATLVNRETGTRLIVANAHLDWAPEYRDVKLVQTALLMDFVKGVAEDFADMEVGVGENVPARKYANGSQIPLIVCGDYNSVPESGVYELMTRGHVPGSHPDFMGHSYGPLTTEGPSHPFELRSSYAAAGELSVTNYTPSFKGGIDYIFYGSENLEVGAVLGEIDKDYLSKCAGFPNAHFPSDHVLVSAQFRILPPKESKPQPAKSPAFTNSSARKR